MAVLSNFYRDNAPEAYNFDISKRVMAAVFNAMTAYVAQIRRNFVIGEMETYRIIPVQTIPAADGLYDIQTLLCHAGVESLLGLQGKTITERIAAWDAMASNDLMKIKALDVYGAYISLSAIIVPESEIKIPNPSYNIVSMDIYSDDTKFQIGVDFDIRSNKLYLLSSDMSSKTLNESASFVCKHIAIDFDTPTRYIGKNFNLPRYPDLSKDVYNDMLANLTTAALAGPEIRNMAAGVDIITGGKGSTVIYDRWMKNNKRAANWYDYNLSPFDFIIEIPASYMSSESMADIIKRYIDTVKLADTNYTVLFNSMYEDQYARPVEAVDDVVVSPSVSTDDVYNYMVIFPQTNNVAYTLNGNFMTAVMKGYSREDDYTITVR